VLIQGESDYRNGGDRVILELFQNRFEMKIHIQVQNQFGGWQHFQTMNHQPSAFRSAQNRAKSTGKRHRLVNEDGAVLDLVDP